MWDSDIRRPTAGGVTQEQFTKLAANELIVVLGYPIIGKSVILLVNINYLQLQVVLTTRCCTIIQIDKLLPWLLDFHLTVSCCLFMVTNIGKFSPHILLPLA